MRAYYSIEVHIHPLLRNMRKESNMKKIALLSCISIILAVVVVLLPQNEMPVRAEARCGPGGGEVQNNSSYTLNLEGDALVFHEPSNTYQFQVVWRELPPGQHSDSIGICDVDKVNIETNNWYMNGYRNQDSWVYVGPDSITCRNGDDLPEGIWPPIITNAYCG